MTVSDVESAGDFLGNIVAGPGFGGICRAFEPAMGVTWTN